MWCWLSLLAPWIAMVNPWSGPLGAIATIMCDPFDPNGASEG